MRPNIAAQCFLVSLVIGLGVASCGDDDGIVRTIGEKRFAIPRQFAITSDFEWLPKSKKDEVLFTLNPNDKTTDQVVVLLQSNDKFCGEPKSLSPEVRDLCQTKSAVSPDILLFDEGLTRVVDQTGIWWRYETVKSASEGTTLVVAECFKSNAGGNSGNCTSLGLMSGTFYSFGLNHKNIDRLAYYHSEIRKKLSEWVVK